MTKPSPLLLALAAAMSAGVLAGCPPVSPRPGDTQPSTRAAQGPFRNLPDAPILGSEPVAKGVYVAVDRHLPLTDQALAKARLSRGEVLAAVTAIATAAATPAATMPAATASAPAPAAAEPVASPTDERAVETPPQAVKYYLQGRQRFLEGANSEAIAALEQALQLDPQAFTVLRLMGRVCFAGAQLARGATYLERAHALRPDDVEVNYLLGRYWMERNDNDRAVYFLIQAEDSPERLITSTHTPLSAFYLAVALQLGGYHLAAAREQEHFLELAEMPVPGYRYDGELSYLINMQWASHLAAAENYARVGDYRAALPHYQAAAAARPDDLFIASRVINALVYDGRQAPAQKAALALAAATRGTEDAIRLLTWTYQAAGREGALIDDLRAHLKAALAPGAPESQELAAAITLSEAQAYLGRKTDAAGTLAEFVEKHPKNLDVLGRLLKRVDTGPTFATALIASADAIAADKENSLEVLRLFLPVAEGAPGAAYVKGQAHAPPPRTWSGTAAPPSAQANDARLSFALFYLEALARQAQNLPPEQVEEAYDASLTADAGFFPAREAFVFYLLGRENFAKAAAVIDDLMRARPGDAKAWQLQVDSEIAQDRYVHALQLAQDACARFPDDIDLRMQLVAAYRLRGQDQEADAELQGLIKNHPRYETAYRSLINSLFLRTRRPGTDPNATLAVIVAALNKMSVELPDSHFGRVATAVVYSIGGRGDDAEAVLRSALMLDPDDPDALVSLAQVLDRMGRTPEGMAVLESALQRKPQLDLVRSLAGMYRADGRKADALALAGRYARENPDSESAALLYAAELSTQGKRPEGVTVLTDAFARFPRSQALAVALSQLQEEGDDYSAAIATLRQFIKANGETTDRLYLLARFYSTANDDDASVAALQRVLAIMPDHIGANNDLGYFWVNAGIHLEQAEPMIRKALDNRPDDPAFLDSLAWLYYKQGKFAEARTLLEKALALPGGLAPEVVQHLGDTLYRLDRVPDAIEQWAKALQMLQIADRLTSADRKERDYLTQAVAEARAGRTPAVSPLADSDKSRSAGPAATPATMPQN